MTRAWAWAAAELPLSVAAAAAVLLWPLSGLGVHYAPMALLSFLSAALFLAVITLTRKPASAQGPADSRPAAALRG